MVILNITDWSTEVAEFDMTAKVFADIYQSPVTSGDMYTLILMDTVCSTHVAEGNVTEQAHSDIFQSPAN